MRNFLDIAARLHAEGKSGARSESFKRVFAAISRLQAVHSKAEFDLINIESIFTAFELAKTLDRFPGAATGEIDELIDDLKWLIVSTLQQTIRFPVESSIVRGHPEIVGFLKAIHKASGSEKPDTAILTFNYDMLFDMALLGVARVDYGIGKQPGNGVCFPLLKLHGSLNWTTNLDDNSVFPWFLSKYFSRFNVGPFYEAKDAGVPIGDQLVQYGKGTDETEKVSGIPVIVPPSWNKADSHRAISKVWSRAAEELSDAKSIFVVGYSLPDTDSFFRQLYALGTVGETLLERFWVFNPDQSREPVFRAILGPGARERYRFFQKSFGEAISLIRSAISE